jgi:hypothetical protein
LWREINEIATTHNKRGPRKDGGIILSFRGAYWATWESNEALPSMDVTQPHSLRIGKDHPDCQSNLRFAMTEKDNGGRLGQTIGRSTSWCMSCTGRRRRRSGLWRENED